MSNLSLLAGLSEEQYLELRLKQAGLSIRDIQQIKEMVLPSEDKPPTKLGTFPY